MNKQRFILLLAAAALVSFVVLSQFIGSLPGLLAVAATFYLTLRSIGNGLGVVLKEAWGWTRPHRQRLTPLERLVASVVQATRRRKLALVSRDEGPVRTLAPPLAS